MKSILEYIHEAAFESIGKLYSLVTRKKSESVDGIKFNGLYPYKIEFGGAVGYGLIQRFFNVRKLDSYNSKIEFTGVDTENALLNIISEMPLPSSTDYNDPNSSWAKTLKDKLSEYASDKKDYDNYFQVSVIKSGKDLIVNLRGLSTGEKVKVGKGKFGQPEGSILQGISYRFTENK